MPGLVVVDADLFFVKVIPVLGKETSDYSATDLIKFIESFFHKHVRLRCDGEPATVALANKVGIMAGDLVKFEATPKHSSASNPAERMRFGISETFAPMNRSEHGFCVMQDGKPVDTNRKATE